MSNINIYIYIVMKKVLFLIFITFLGISFSSCSSSDDDGTNPGSEQSNFKIHDNNIVGVWKCGNYYFVSFSSDKHNASLISNKFLDEGDYSIKGDTITVSNKYFGNETRYVVNSLTSDKLSMTITYNDRWEGKKTETMSFTKSEDEPCTKTNDLVGKSYYAQYSVSHGSQHWNKTFLTYNTISCTRSDAASSTPSTFYYVYMKPTIYFYVIRSNEFYYDTVRCGKVEFNSNNQIDGMGSLYGDKLY